MAPGPLEGHATRFDDLSGRLAQRRGFREYLVGLPAPRPGILRKGKNDPASGTKLAIGAGLAVQTPEAGFAFRAVVADCAYGDQDGFRAGLAGAGLPFVMALKPRRGTWAYGPDAHTPVDVAREPARGRAR